MLSGCKAESPEILNILFVGDSDIEGWDTETYENAKNIGVGGATCQDILPQIETTLESYLTKKVVLVCGENDFPDHSASDTFTVFKNIVEKIEATNATVLYMGTKPEPETIDLHQQYRQYDSLIRQHAVDLANTENPPLVMIDVYSGFEELGNPNSLYAEDQLHLSNEGYSYWNQWLQSALADNTCTVWQSGSCIHNAGD